jgi:hypothetical protein
MYENGGSMEDHPKEKNIFKTSDLGIAVYLFTIQHELHKTTLQGPKRLVFHFIKQANTEGRVAAYLNETGQAPAKKLFENYRALRALAFSQTGNLR